jgi:hypothetical protein
MNVVKDLKRTNQIVRNERVGFWSAVLRFFIGAGGW